MWSFPRSMAAALMLLSLAFPPSALAQDSPADAPPEAKLDAADLEELLSPIALYPDSLLANVLTACVYPSEVAAAAKHVASGKKVEASTKVEWEDSVKAAAMFPDVIKMMGENAEWVDSVGQAYLVQSAEVMSAVQSLRARAWGNGALKSTEQQTVVTEGSTIIIEPADPEIIYVPSYNPSVVYVDDDDDEWVAGAIGWGVGITTGLILANNWDCDWHGGCVGWGHGGHADIDIETGDINIGTGDRTTNIDRGDRTTNIDNSRTNNANRNRPGQEGAKWQPNSQKVSKSQYSKPARKPGNTAGGQGGVKVPGRDGASKPIASNRPPGSPKPKAGQTARPSSATKRADGAKPSGGAGKPAAKPKPSSGASKSKPKSSGSSANRSSSSSSRSSGFSPSSSGSRSSGGGSRGGGGGSRGGGGGGRGGGGRR